MKSNNQKVDKIYHIHTYFCGHATNSVSGVVQYAIKNNYTRLVFTEHCPLKNNSKIRRPHESQLKTLREQINHYNEKYKGKLLIEFGYECEFPFAQRKKITELVNDGICDFFILGVHFFGNMWKTFKYAVYDTDEKDLESYYQMTSEALESGLFSWVAHPDVWCGSYGKWDNKAIDLTQKLIDLSIKYDIPLGFNANGLASKRDDLHYPCKPFWEMVAKSKAKVLIESDSHFPMVHSIRWMNYAYDTAVSFGLKNNIVEDVELKLFKKN